VIGWKSVMRATSDVAAMGGEPRCFLLSLALPSNLAAGWLDQFLTGMTRAAKKLGCVLAGGDTTRADKILINVTVIGEVPNGSALLRSGAKPGDLIFATGRLGEAELGLRLARNARRLGKGGRGELLKKHLFPEARIALGQWLGKAVKASAAMDLSDGLSLDLHRLCAASGVGAEIRADQLPIASSKFAKAFNASQRLEAALHGGDDYELLFCVPPKHCGRIPSSKFGVTLTQIGEIVSSRKISLAERDGKKTTLLPRGWDPFR
jgi:thiamine-monophosphate kinase